MSGFRLPLGDEEFGHAARAGLGRAAMHLFRYGPQGVLEQLLDVCRCHPAYDPQCEWDRTDWVLGLVRLARVEPQAREAVGETLRAGTHHWDIRHAAELAAALGEREALYAALERQAVEDWVVGELIVRLDGLEGARRVLAIAREPLDPTLAEALEEVGALVDRPVADSSINALGMVPILNRLTRDPNAYAELTFEQARAGRCLISWGAGAPREALMLCLEALVRTSDPELATELLSAFARRALPEFDRRLLVFLDGSEPLLRRRTATALSNTPHPLIREAVLERLARDGLSSHLLVALSSNVEAGDAALFSSQLPREPDHDLVSGVVDMYARSPPPDAVEPLLWAYERSPCSNCRGEAVKILARLEALPGWLVEEAEFDCNEVVREAVRS